MCNVHCSVCFPFPSFIPPSLSSFFPCMHDLLHAIISISGYSEFAQKKCTSSLHFTFLFFSPCRTLLYLSVLYRTVAFSSSVYLFYLSDLNRFSSPPPHTHTHTHTNTRTYALCHIFNGDYTVNTPDIRYEDRSTSTSLFQSYFVK